MSQADLLYARLVQQEAEMLQEFYNEVIQGNANIGQPKEALEGYKEVSVNKLLEMFFRTGAHEDAKKLQDKCQISDKRFLLTRVKVMIESRNSEDGKMIQLVQEKNRKKIEVPYEIVADVLKRNDGTREDVCKVLFMMPDIEEQILLLLRCQYKRRPLSRVLNSARKTSSKKTRNNLHQSTGRKLMTLDP